VPHGLASSDIPSPLMSDLVMGGIDAVVLGQPSGFALALHVRCALRGLMSRIHRDDERFQQKVEEAHQRAQEAAQLREINSDILWRYLPPRLKTAIPAIDTHIAADATKVAGHTLGRTLGQGSFGRVCMIKSAGGRCVEAMKIVSKRQFSELADVQRVQRIIEIMRRASHWRHPNVVQFHEVHHSKTDLFFCLEFAGSENLRQRLTRRSDESAILSVASTLSIASQAAAAVAHLHGEPCICHLDIKPENYVITVSGVDQESVVVKLTDFDLAVHQEPGMLCSKCCGTLPFIAPEVMSRNPYDGFAADAWSLGIILLEIQCGVCVLERFLKLSGKQSRDDVVQKIAWMASRAEGVSDVLTMHGLAALHPLMSVMDRLVPSLLQVDVDQRWHASTASDYLRASNVKMPRCLRS